MTLFNFSTLLYAFIRLISLTLILTNFQLTSTSLYHVVILKDDTVFSGKVIIQKTKVYKVGFSKEIYLDLW